MRVRLSNFQRSPLSCGIVQLAFGILVGTLIGFSAKYEYETDSVGPSVIPQSAEFGGEAQSEVGRESGVNLRCVVIVHRSQVKKAKYVSAIRDTYASQCNDTLFFTDSKDLQNDFAEELEMIYVDTWQTEYYWNFYRQVIRYLVQNPRKKSTAETQNWTVIGNEQMYLVVENLKRYLETKDAHEKIVFARITHTRSLLSLIFPFGSQTSASTQAGVVLSDSALTSLGSDLCSGWLFPVSTEKAIPHCCKLAGVTIVTPIDREGMKLLNAKDPKTLIPISANKRTSKSKKGGTETIVECCSESVISFGSMNYKQQRMIDFVLTRVRVFGVAPNPFAFGAIPRRAASSPRIR